MVNNAYTGANPWAMMVHSEDAFTTDGAMVGSRWLYPVALFAMLVSD